MATKLNFDGRVAVVTGGGRGIGRSYALLLAQLGANVVVNDLGGMATGDGSDAEPAHNVAQEIISAGGSAFADVSDVSTAEGGQAVIDAAIENFGRLDILINNAGNMIWGGPPEVDADNIQRHLAVHVMGSFNTTRAAWPHFLSQNYGRVILTTSVGMFGLPDNLGYAICKSGMIGMAHSLTVAAEEHDIKVNVIAPNATTRLGIAPSKAASQVAGSDSPQLPTEFVAPMVAFLAHESCPVSAEMYVAGAGRFGRLFLAATEGYLHPDPTNLRVEDIADHWNVINDEDGYYVPRTLNDWAMRFMSHRI